MTRTVFCSRNKKELVGLERPPMPGAIGREVYDNLSSEAWAEWTALQTILINENKLSLMELSSREFLEEKLKEFMAGNDIEKPPEYVGMIDILEVT